MTARTIGRIVATTAGILVLLQATRAAVGFVFTPLDFPGAVLTNAQGINAQGEIVGFYTDTAGRTHGFSQSGGFWRSIDFPDSAASQALGISPAGDIVGTYQRPAEAGPIAGAIPIHGFLMTRRGGFFKVDYPGHQNTIAQRILPDGTVLGCYHDGDRMDSMFGMSVSRRGFDRTTEPMSMHNGATPDGELIVGLFPDIADGRGKGYIIRRGAFSAFEVPGSAQTQAWDVNPAGLIVGVFRDNAGAFHGFQYDGRTFGRVDVPGATATRVFGVNPRGEMVGAFIDTAGRTHGFVAQWMSQ